MPADAHFCEACGARVDAVATVLPSAPPLVQPAPPGPIPPPIAPGSPFTPRPVPPSIDPSADRPRLPVQRAPGAGLVLAVLAVGLLLLGAAGFWLYGQFDRDSGANRPSIPSSSPYSAPSDTTVERDPDALIPDRAPPTAGDIRPSDAAAGEGPAPSVADEPLPPIPVTDDPVDLEGLKSRVVAAHARDVEAFFAASPDPPAPESRAALADAIRALAKGLYRHHVVDGQGDLEAARTELRFFLIGLEHKGLGLSEDAVEEGIADVGP